jgi:hypothetical protein
LVSGQGVHVSEFAAYLALIDGIYGRVLRSSYHKYSLTQNSHVKISEVRFGSLEIVISEFVDILRNPSPIVMTYLFLRLLPTISTSLKTLAEAYSSYETGRLTRENRRKIREEMKKDEKLSSLPPERIQQIAAVIERLTLAETKHVPAARRLAQQNVKFVNLSLKRKDS